MTDNKNLTEHPDFVQENDKPAALNYLNRQDAK